MKANSRKYGEKVKKGSLRKHYHCDFLLFAGTKKSFQTNVSFTAHNFMQVKTCWIKFQVAKSWKLFLLVIVRCMSHTVQNYAMNGYENFTHHISSSETVAS